MKKIKRALYLTHRWFGVALCLVFALWFASGIVMMYVEYPELTEEERIQSLPPLAFDEINTSISQLQNDILPSDAGIDQITLTSLFDRPVYLLRLDRGQTVTVFADSGTILSNITEEKALVTAASFMDESEATLIDKIDMDQWTISGDLNPHRPLYKVALNNDANSIVYVSSLTGQIVRDTHGWERAWNWVGSTIHWIYPMQLRRHPGLWADVIIYLSLLGVVAVLTGTFVGYLRLRLKKRYKNGSVTPYKGMQKWHHLLGLACVIFVATFLVSGLFSMNPWGIFDNKVSSFDQIKRYQGDGYSLAGFQQAFNEVKNQKPDDEIKELHWQQLGGKGHFIAATDNGRNALGFSDVQLDQTIQEHIPQLIPGLLSEVQRLDSFDNYYYSTHNRYRPLPVYRAVFSDSEETWFYIDINTAELLGRSTSIDRVERWLYNGLHSLDFRFLLDYRPAWDLVVIILSIAGLIFCYTSIIIAWRRVLIKTGSRKKAKHV